MLHLNLDFSELGGESAAKCNLFRWVMICFTPTAQRHACLLLAEPAERAATGPVDRRKLWEERKG